MQTVDYSYTCRDMGLCVCLFDLGPLFRGSLTLTLTLTLTRNGGPPEWRAVAVYSLVTRLSEPCKNS